MLVLNPLTFKEEEVEVGEFEGHEVITFQDGRLYDLKTLLEANKHLIKYVKQRIFKITKVFNE